MSDQELRELEKTRALDPSVANRWRYARALERAGLRRELFCELCELARAGDVEARGRVEAWTPWTARTGSLGRRRALDPTRPRRVRSHELAVPVLGDIEIVAATDDALFVSGPVEGGHFLGAIALDPFAPRWHTDDASHDAIAIVGDDVVHADAQGLVLRDGRTGEILARLDGAGPPSNLLHAAGDRLVVEWGHAHSGVSIGVEGIRGPRWTRAEGEAEVVAVSSEHLVLHGMGGDVRAPAVQTTCRRLADGIDGPTSFAFGAPEPEARYAHGAVRALGSDAIAALARTSRASTTLHDRIVALRLETGAVSGGRLPFRECQESLPPERFDATAEAVALARHGSHEFGHAGTPRALEEVVLVQRSELSATPPFPEVGRVIARPRDLRALAFAREALYLATLESPHELLVSARDPRTGAILWEETVGVPRTPWRGRLVPIDGALLVVGESWLTTTVSLARIENTP